MTLTTVDTIVRSTKEPSGINGLDKDPPQVQIPGFPRQLVRTKEASWIRYEISSRSTNKSSCPWLLLDTLMLINFEKKVWLSKKKVVQYTLSSVSGIPSFVCVFGGGVEYTIELVQERRWLLERHALFFLNLNLDPSQIGHILCACGREAEVFTGQKFCPVLTRIGTDVI